MENSFQSDTLMGLLLGDCLKSSEIRKLNNSAVKSREPINYRRSLINKNNNFVKTRSAIRTAVCRNALLISEQSCIVVVYGVWWSY